jgi:hypothetical protein
LVKRTADLRLPEHVTSVTVVLVRETHEFSEPQPPPLELAQRFD